MLTNDDALRDVPIRQVLQLREDAARQLEAIDRSTFPRIKAWKILTPGQMYVFYTKNMGAGEIGVVFANILLSVALVFNTPDLIGLLWYQILISIFPTWLWAVIWLVLTTVSVFAFITGHVVSRKWSWRISAIVWCAMFGAIWWNVPTFSLLKYLMLDIGIVSAISSTRLRDIERIHKRLRQSE
jgi:hypothetical protein